MNWGRRYPLLAVPGWARGPASPFLARDAETILALLRGELASGRGEDRDLPRLCRAIARAGRRIVRRAARACWSLTISSGRIRPASACGRRLARSAAAPAAPADRHDAARCRSSEEPAGPPGTPPTLAARAAAATALPEDAGDRAGRGASPAASPAEDLHIGWPPGPQVTRCTSPSWSTRWSAADGVTVTGTGAAELTRGCGARTRCPRPSPTASASYPASVRQVLRAAALLGRRLRRVRPGHTCSAARVGQLLPALDEACVGGRPGRLRQLA